MEVIICRNKKLAIHPNGDIVPIEKIRIVKENEEFVEYGPETSFYKAALQPNTKHNAILVNGKLTIL